METSQNHPSERVISSMKDTKISPSFILTTSHFIFSSGWVQFLHRIPYRVVAIMDTKQDAFMAHSPFADFPIL